MAKKDLENLEVGDKIVDFGKVYEIFEIGEKEVLGEKEKAIFFKPFYETRANKDLVCSIPRENLDETDIRLPTPKKALKKALKELKQPVEEIRRLNLSRNRGVMASNELEKTIEVVRQLWAVKEDEDHNFTTTKKRAYRTLMRRLVEEVGLVYDKDLKEARRFIKRKLKAASKAMKEAKEAEEEDEE